MLAAWLRAAQRQARLRRCFASVAAHCGALVLRGAFAAWRGRLASRRDKAARLRGALTQLRNCAVARALRGWRDRCARDSGGDVWLSLQLFITTFT